MEIKKQSAKEIENIKTKKIKCPICKKASTEPFIPFCSKKCSDLDLMRWLSDENYIDLNS